MAVGGNTDLIVVGAGILGVFHAYHALNEGLEVWLFEKNNRPQGATVRNFGQVVPSGLGSTWQRYGRESLAIYQELQGKVNLTSRNEGSIYLASDRDELGLLEELADINRSNDYPSILLTQEECLSRWPNLRPDYVKGGLYFPQEITVDAPHMIHHLLDYLVREMSLHYRPGTLVREVVGTGNGCQVVDSAGVSYYSEKVVVCNGSNLLCLFPNIFIQSDLQLTKLQMLRLVPQASVKLTGNILTGLTIRRYESFRECPSWEQVKSREDADSLWKKWGVHILFKQSLDGSVVLGDSHEYFDAKDADKMGFALRQDINTYLLEEAKKIMTLDSWEVESCWAGVYSQCKNQDIFLSTVDDNIHIVTGIGGKGMTVGPGFAKVHLQQIGVL